MKRDFDKSIHLVETIIRDEAYRVDHNRIFLGGFGEWFAIAYVTFFRDPDPFAGLVGISGKIILTGGSRIEWEPGHIGSALPHQVIPTPVFFTHCRDDVVIPVEEGRKLQHIFRTRTRARIKYREYEGEGHKIKEPHGVNDLALFLDGAVHSDPPNFCYDPVEATKLGGAVLNDIELLLLFRRSRSRLYDSYRYLTKY